MGSKQSTNNNSTSRAEEATTLDASYSTYRNSSQRASVPEQPILDRQRARSLATALDTSQSSSPIYTLDVSQIGTSSASPGDIYSAGDDSSSSGTFTAHSLPLHIFPFNGFKCPVCSKVLISEDIEYHLVMCFSKPQLNYNEDVLTEDRDIECVICLEEMLKGNKIARLPCLCIYHKKCIDKWFQVNRSCPEHPSC